MSRLEELGKNRLIVLNHLLSSQKLCKSVWYEQSNYLDQPDIEDTSELINKNIFPFNHIPKLADTASSYVTFSFQDYRPAGTQFKSGLLHFQVLIHKDLLLTDYEILRYDQILASIDELFNENTKLGIGKLEFYRMDEIFVNEKYVGFFIKYKLWDFN
ncbi:hypothetical protein L8C07_05240 [Paenibacillus sp. CMAA1739]|uniref:hypothetical protein n=1 Tax=Paenibacillus ottowii TaxID=2315729 RepID=UPI002DBE859F|nr:hypothetical protein [Paenibacillus sp. CMAA1739]MEC4565341.1 hypothetical protein [Paenibacillus sp. CMAA1739]